MFRGYFPRIILPPLPCAPRGQENFLILPPSLRASRLTKKSSLSEFTDQKTLLFASRGKQKNVERERAFRGARMCAPSEAANDSPLKLKNRQQGEILPPFFEKNDLAVIRSKYLLQ